MHCTIFEMLLCMESWYKLIKKIDSGQAKATIIVAMTEKYVTTEN
jgi:hypothetical protein